MQKPTKQTTKCPCCGELYFVDQCIYKSHREELWGSLTLYNVCLNCAINNSDSEEEKERLRCLGSLSM